MLNSLYLIEKKRERKIVRQKMAEKFRSRFEIEIFSDVIFVGLKKGWNFLG
jgi:hypothetical protein